MRPRRFRDAPIPAEDDKTTTWGNVRTVLLFFLFLGIVAYGNATVIALYLGFWAGWWAHQAKTEGES